MLIIDGQYFNVPVAGIDLAADFLDKYAERSEDGTLHRELIGVYFNYKLSLATTLSTSEFSRLWNKLTEPEEFHTVTVPGPDGDFTYVAYFSNIKAKLLRTYKGMNYFSELTVNFTAQSPARS